jgi:hypothetical protein
MHRLTVTVHLPPFLLTSQPSRKGKKTKGKRRRGEEETCFEISSKQQQQQYFLWNISVLQSKMAAFIKLPKTLGKLCRVPQLQTEILYKRNWLKAE